MDQLILQHGQVNTCCSVNEGFNYLSIPIIHWSYFTHTLLSMWLCEFNNHIFKINRTSLRGQWVNSSCNQYYSLSIPMISLTGSSPSGVAEHADEAPLPAMWSSGLRSSSSAERLLAVPLDSILSVRVRWDSAKAWLQHGKLTVKSLTPGRFGYDYKNVIFSLALQIGIFRSYDYVIRWMPQALTDDKSTLGQVMAWCRQAASHYQSQCWPSSMWPYTSLGHNELSFSLSLSQNRWFSASLQSLQCVSSGVIGVLQWLVAWRHPAITWITIRHIINGIQWHLPRANFTGSLTDIDA